MDSKGNSDRSAALNGWQDTLPLSLSEWRRLSSVIKNLMSAF